jgi:hypothetical protein
MNVDVFSNWEICAYMREEWLRSAQADRLADELPRHPSAMRMRVSRWLYSLANRLEPSVDPTPTIQPAHVHAR